MNARALHLPLVLMMTLCIIACDADDGSARAKSKPPAEPTTQPTSNMKISLKLREETLTATLYDNPTAKEFASLLPLTLTLEDYSKTEKISDLPRKLTKEGAPAGAYPSAGDIAYYAPWGNLAVFLKDFEYSSGLVLLGKVDSGLDALNRPGPLEVTLERVEE